MKFTVQITRCAHSAFGLAALGVAVLSVAAPPAPAHPHQEQERTPPPEAPPKGDLDPADTQATLPEVLRAAAQTLLSGEGDLPGAAERVASVLIYAQHPNREALLGDLAPLAGKTGAASHQAVVAELARATLLPPDLVTWLAPPDEPATPPPSPELVTALAATLSPDAGAAIYRLSNRFPESNARAALVHLLGLPAGGDDSAFSARIESSLRSPALWMRRVAEAAVRREAAAATDRDRTERVLVDTLRSLHLATPSEARSGLLAGFLSDPMPTVRRVGFDLATRELAAGNPVSNDVVDAATELLAHEDPAVRLRAARLLLRLPPALTGDRLAALARTEQNADVAEIGLVGIARNPTPENSPTILRWLEAASPRASAFDAADAAIAAGVLSSDALEAALAVARQMPAATLPPSAMRILARHGDPADLQRLDELLEAEEPERRRAAAALALRDDRTDALIARAAQDPTMLPAAVDAFARFPDLTRALSLVGIEGAETEIDRVIDRLGSLSVPQRLRFAEEAGDRWPNRTERLLTRLVDEPDHGEQAKLLLAERALRRGQGEVAAGLLNGTTGPNGSDTPEPRLAAARLAAQVLKGGAGSVGDAPAARWLAAAALLPDAAALAVVEHLAAGNAGELSDADAAALERLRERVSHDRATPEKSDDNAKGGDSVTPKQGKQAAPADPGQKTPNEPAALMRGSADTAARRHA